MSMGRVARLRDDDAFLLIAFTTALVASTCSCTATFNQKQTLARGPWRVEELLFCLKEIGPSGPCWPSPSC